jgi:hypothetical protein
MQNFLMLAPRIARTSSFASSRPTVWSRLVGGRTSPLSPQSRALARPAFEKDLAVVVPDTAAVPSKVSAAGISFHPPAFAE